MQCHDTPTTGVDNGCPMDKHAAMHIADLLSTTEAIELLGVDRSTLSRYVKFGDIRPAKRFGETRNAPMLFWKADILRLRDEKIAAGVISA